MMRIKHFIATIFAVGTLVLTGGSMWAQSNQPAGQELTVWTYDSFISEWGPAAQISEAFTKAYGIKLRFVSKGDGGALLSALLSSTKKPDADIVIGLDNNQLEKALSSDLFTPLALKNIDQLRSGVALDPSRRLIPFDYGQFAFIWDSQSGVAAPSSLEDLTNPKYRKKIIIMDPRTSSPGLGFLAWTEAVYGEAWKDYWKRLAPSILAMTPSWDTGYGLFTKGEAPLVLSYSTSPAYHKAYENTERYTSLQFKEGHPMQIEFAGVLSSSPNRGAAQQFIDFLISPECQAFLPETQWMFPANSATKLPASFAVAGRYPAIAGKIRDFDRDPTAAADILTGAP